MVDMTGGISEVVQLTDKKAVPADLYSLLVHSDKMMSIMGGAIYVRLLLLLFMT